MTYQLWVLAGILLGAAVRRLQPADPPALAGHRSALLLAAVIGAIAGAYLLELPADLAGWTAGIPGAAAGEVLGGRTVLGGLLGGWIAVELAKRRRGIRAATGDGFAAPLAAALACGRCGCLAAGCCAGQACPPGWWSATDAFGLARWNAAGAEVVFHAAAAVALLVAARRGWWPGRRLAAYLAAYAALRFLLEGVRLHPPVLLGLSYYQLLALALAGLAGATWWLRRGAAPATAAGA